MRRAAQTKTPATPCASVEWRNILCASSASADVDEGGGTGEEETTDPGPGDGNTDGDDEPFELDVMAGTKYELASPHVTAGWVFS